MGRDSRAPLSRRRWLLRLIVGGMLGALLNGLVSLTLKPRTYGANMSVVFPLPASGIGGASGIRRLLGADAVIPNNSALPLTGYTAALESRRAMVAVAKRLGIAELYKLPNEQSVVGMMRQWLKVSINSNQTVVIDCEVPGTASIRSLRDFTNRRQANERDARYRVLATQIPTTLVDEMGRIADDIMLDRAKHKVTALTERAKQDNEKLRQAADRLANMQTDVGDLAPNEYARSLGSTLLALQQQLVVANASVQRSRAARSQAWMQLNKQLAALNKLPSDNPLLMESRKQYRDALARYERLSRMYGAENVEVGKALQDVKDSRRALDADLSGAKQGMVPAVLSAEAQAAASEAERDSLEAQVKGWRAQLLALPQRAAKLAMIEAEFLAQQETLKAVESALVAAEIDFEQSGVQWTILDPPMLPLHKRNPSTFFALILGMFVGGFIAAIPLVPPLLAELFRIASEPAGAEENKAPGELAP